MDENANQPVATAAALDGLALDGTLAAHVPAELAAKVPSGFRHRVSIAGDLSGNGRFGRSWVGADDTRVLAVSEEGPTVDVLFSDVTDFKVEELFGASRLLAVGKDTEHVLATYSRNLVSEFALFSRVLDDMRKGEAVVLPDTLERAVCMRCGAPLPERGATCPRCLSRGSILKRVLTLLSPYRWQVGGLVTFAMLGVGASVVPPLTYEMIADRVLEGGNPDQLVLWVGVMLAALLLGTAFNFLTAWANAWLGSRIVADLRALLHARAQKLHLRYHNRHPGKNVTLLGERHLVLRDTAGNRYEIPDTAALDPRSQSWIAGSL